VKRLILILRLLLLLSGVCIAQQEASSSSACSQGEVNRTAAQVDAVRKRLLELPIGDGLHPDVSPVAQHAIASMKDALGELVNAYLHCVSGQPVTTNIEKELSTLGHAFEMPSGSIQKENIPPDFGKFGFELSFKAKTF
jgi:hypothetical protein